MIVKREGFFGGLIVDHNGTKRWVGFKHRHEIVSKPAIELAWFCHRVTLDDVLSGGTTNELTII